MRCEIRIKPFDPGTIQLVTRKVDDFMKIHPSCLLTTLLLVVLVLVSCSKDDDIMPMEADGPDLPETPFNYVNISLPAHFTMNVPGQPLPTSVNGNDNSPVNNPVTNEGATLGRVLFYDK